MSFGSWFLVLGSWLGRRPLRRRYDARGGVAPIVAAAALLLAVVCLASFAHADGSGMARVKLIVADSVDTKSDDEAYERARLEEITKVAAKRLRKRLKAAQIKKYDVEIDHPGTLRVSAGGGVSHALLAGIVAPQGRFGLHPVEPVGERWTNVSASLPDRVELRQEKGSLSANEAYLWSKSRRKLSKTVGALELEGLEVKTYPADGGWRTFALGAPVATHEDVAHADIRPGKTGDVYVRLTFEHKVSAAHLTGRTRRTWAIVLDGEVVATFKRIDSKFGGSLTVSAPEHLQTKSARMQWAQQVAGRLAAFMSVPLVEIADD